MRDNTRERAGVMGYGNIATDGTDLVYGLTDRDLID